VKGVFISLVISVVTCACAGVGNSITATKAGYKAETTNLMLTADTRCA